MYQELAEVTELQDLKADFVGSDDSTQDCKMVYSTVKISMNR